MGLDTKALELERGESKDEGDEEWFEQDGTISMAAMRVTKAASGGGLGQALRGR